jgi:hypothetical protein
MTLSLDRSTLEAALVGYQHQLQEIDSKMAEVRSMLGKTSTAAPKAKTTRHAAPKKHLMSAEGRARIADAQRARWAKAKKVPA